MALIENPAAKFMELKKPDALRCPVAENLQDTIEIQRVSPEGMFEIGQDRYSRTFEIGDINFSNMGYEEQIVFYDSWTKMIASMRNPYKITIMNSKRNMKKMRENVLYPMKGDAYDEARDCYNDIMMNKIIDGKQGIEQRKYLTVTVDKKGGTQEAAKTVDSVEAGVIKEYAGFGSYLTPLSGTERLKILHDFYRGREDFDYSVEKWVESGNDWRNDICPDNITFLPKHIELSREFEDKYLRVLYIDPHSYGDSMEDKFFVELSSISACSVFSIDIVPVPKNVTQKVLINKYMNIEDMIAKQQQRRNKQHNFSSEISYRVRKEKEEIEVMLDAVRKNGQLQYWVGVTIVLMADSMEELERHTGTLEQICTGAGCRLNIATQMQREGLNTALPIGVRNTSFMRAMFTQSAGSFIPFNVMELTDENHPFWYGVNKVSKNPILYNRKQLINASGFVFGIPGSGKSMTGSKMEIGSIYLTTEDDIIIIDPQAEYMELCDAFGGSYINFSSSTDHHINPFHCSNSDLRAENIENMIKDKEALVNGVIASMINGQMASEIITLSERCTRAVYEKQLTLPEEERCAPLMSDFHAAAVKQIEEERKKGFEISAKAAETLALIAERFISGPMEIFNHQTNVDMDNRLVVFGIKDLNDSLWGMTMNIVLSYINSRVQENFKKGITTWLYIDEFAYMTKTKYTKDYAIEAWRVFRKFGGIPTGIIQNAATLLGDKELETLISNSQYSMFLKQAPNDVKAILSAFSNISEAQMDFITSAAPGTGIIRFGDVIISMDNQIEKTNPIYDIFNTNPQEKAAKKKAEEKRRVIERGLV